MQYIVDTNALIYATKKNQDLANKIHGQILIPNLVINELEKLSKTAKKKSDRDASKLAIFIIKHKKWQIIKLEKGHTDTKIREYAAKNKCKIFTFDKELKRAEHKL